MWVPPDQQRRPSAHGILRFDSIAFAVTADTVLNNEAQLRPRSQLNASAKLARHETSLLAPLACSIGATFLSPYRSEPSRELNRVPTSG